MCVSNRIYSWGIREVEKPRPSYFDLYCEFIEPNISGGKDFDETRDVLIGSSKVQWKRFEDFKKTMYNETTFNHYCMTTSAATAADL